MFPAYHHSLTGSRISWPESAKFAAAIGFPACDIWLEKAMKAGVASTLETLASNGLRTSVVDMPVDFRASEETFQSGMKELPEMANFAAAIGCRRMTARLDPSAPLPKSEWRPIQQRRLRNIASILGQSDVQLAIEFVASADVRRLQEHEFLWRMGETLEFLEDTGSNVGLLLDSWHWHYASATAEDIRHAGAARIFHVHLNDAPEQFFDHVVDKERLMPGEGVIDLLGFLQALQGAGYRDAVSVEVFGTSLKTLPPERCARHALESTLQVFRKAGIPGAV